MTAEYGMQYSPLEQQWEYYVDSNNCWVWYGIGQILSSDKGIYLCPYFPASFSGKCKEIHGKVSDKIGRKIGKRIRKHYNKHHIKQIP